MKRLLIFMMIVFISGGSFAGNKTKKNTGFSKKSIEKVMKKVAFWQLRYPKHELYAWTNGAFYSGVMAAWETTGSKKLYRGMMKMGKENDWQPGPRLQHADDYAICQTYVDLYRIEKDPQMIEPFVKRMDEFMQTPFQGEGNRKVTWWWCDALFMMPPALVKLGITLHEDRHLSLSDKLFKECYDFLYDKEAHLFFRDLRFVSGADPELKEANGEKVFWSRGNGWVVGGLVKLLQELPADYPERPFYEQLFKEMVVKIITLQQKDGLWRASLLDPESYPGGEASGSGFFCYALA